MGFPPKLGLDHDILKGYRPRRSTDANPTYPIGIFKRNEVRSESALRPRFRLLLRDGGNRRNRPMV